MNLSLKRKYDLIGIGLIILLFILSIYVRKENLKAPLSRHHEWITAHALITAEVWDRGGGPSQYDFNPVYTYQGEGNAYNRMLGGVTDKVGDTYYVSYPPLAYIYLYYTSQFVGGPSVFSVRVAGLSLQFFTALLLFFLIAAIRPPTEKERFNYGGLVAACLYIFAQGNLWFHGNLFFSDMMVQPLFVGGLLCAVNYFKGNYKRESVQLGLLFLVFFLATYAEWLGLFGAFFTGLLFLIVAIVKKRKQFYRPFLVIGLGSALALALTVYQYTSIDGWNALKETSEKKYAERSGQEAVNSNDVRFTIGHEGSFTTMKQTFGSYYKNSQNFAGISLGILILFIGLRLIKKLNIKPHSDNLLWGMGLIGLIILPILLHYYLFYNFNAMHYFSGLKTSTLIVVLAGIAVQMIVRIAAHTHHYVEIGFIAFFALFLALKSQKAVERYKADHTLEMIDYDRVASAKTIAQKSSPNVAVFTNVRLSPEQVYYAKHNIHPIKSSDSTAMRNILKLYRNTVGQYYHHEGSVLKSMTRIELQGDNLVFLDTVAFE